MKLFKCNGHDVSQEARERGIEGVSFQEAENEEAAMRQCDAELVAHGKKPYAEHPYEIIEMKPTSVPIEQHRALLSAHELLKCQLAKAVAERGAVSYDSRTGWTVLGEHIVRLEKERDEAIARGEALVSELIQDRRWNIRSRDDYPLAMQAIIAARRR